ncbi:helix-turn-helix transcriptional regulator, partial [bacterium]|nr:helix-turn-helix transcriptional regulator [bacterium]
MNQTNTLLDTLKKYLKAKGINYKQLADEMKLSEASVKRLFSKKTVSLSRLEEVCRILDIDFYDLALMDKQKSEGKAKTLSLEQEQVLVKDQKLTTFLYFLINGWPIALITKEYEYSESEAIDMLGRLESIGLLEIHPNNHIRMLISNNVFWQTNGPLWEAYHRTFFDDFMDNPFDRPNNRLVFSPGQFSEASLKVIRKKIDNLVKEFNQLAEMDSALPLKDRHSTGLMIGFRPWVFS